MTNTSRLDALNSATTTEAAEDLRACNASPRWVRDVLAQRPYPDPGALLATGERTARSLAWDEIRAALDAHPRIGERPAGAGTEAQWSRREQSAAATTDAATQEALRAGNAAYEERFGHVFLIRAAGRGAEEVLAELRRRLGNDEERERAEVAEQLAQITRMRLEALLAG